MARVFSIQALKETTIKEFGEERGLRLFELSMESGWPQECEGKTEKEVNKMGYAIGHRWFVEDDPDILN